MKQLKGREYSLCLQIAVVSAIPRGKFAFEWLLVRLCLSSRVGFEGIFG